MITIEKIAETLGVNKSTVSKALRGVNDINPATAEKIRKTAAELGYSKKLGKKNNVIAILVPEIDNAIYSDIANNLIKKSEKLGYSCSVFSYNFNYSNFEKILSKFSNNYIDGFFAVIEDVYGDAFISALKKCDVPFVLISGEDYRLECDCVWINEKYGMELAFDHLVGLGHREFAFIGDNLGSGRAEILKEIAGKKGVIIPDQNVILSGERGFLCGYNCAEKLLRDGAPFTALIAQYDDIALGAIKFLAERGVKVPDDVSVIGFDDAPYCDYCIPSLTSVNSEIERLCEISTAILVKKISDNFSVFQSVLVRPKLNPRNSTATPKKFRN